MALTTRCPQCATTFKVVADQLRIRNGLVRCGVCASVFDGREYLDEAESAPALPTPYAAHAPVAPAAPAAPAPYSPGPHVPYAPAPHAPLHGEQAQSWRDAAVPAAPPVPVAPPVPPPAPDVLRVRAAAPLRADRIARIEPQVASRDRDTMASPVTQQASAYAERQPVARDEYRRDTYTQDSYAQETHAPGAYAHAAVFGERKTSDGTREPALHDQPDDGEMVRGEPRTRYVDDYHSGRTPPSFMDDGAHEAHAQRSRLWGLGCLLLFILLLGMLVHTYRNQVVASFPAMRPVLEAACRPLACTVGYERRIERISVMSSSLRAPPGGATSSGDAQELLLTVVLRNRYNAPQPWPSLSLELKDLADRVVVRKTLRPGDYLPSEVAAQPFGANVERRLTVPISVRNVQVNGYQIDKFFP